MRWIQTNTEPKPKPRKLSRAEQENAKLTLMARAAQRDAKINGTIPYSQLQAELGL